MNRNKNPIINNRIKLDRWKQLTRGIVTKPTYNGVTQNGIVSRKRTEIWSYEHITDGYLSLSSNLLLKPRDLKKMVGNVTIIIGTTISSHTFPKDGERHYTLNNIVHNINDTTMFKKGMYYIKVLYPHTSNIAYNVLVSRVVPPIENTVEQSLPVVDTPKKYALVIGISDYLYIDDLNLCDEDAVVWCNYLKKKGYEITLLGDKTSTYGEYKSTDYATETNIRKHMVNIAALVKPGDQFAFISSGHGSGDGAGNSFICCLDNNTNPLGEYTDKELATDIKLFTDNGAKVIVCFDNCYSGGMLKEITDLNPDNVCATSTCTESGYGYDVSAYNHGAWTYFFLVKTLEDTLIPPVNVNDAYYRAVKSYPFVGKDYPQLSGNGKLMF